MRPSTGSLAALNTDRKCQTTGCMNLYQKHLITNSEFIRFHARGVVAQFG